MTVAPNRILGGKYRLIRPLDKGGMGSVWLAEHLSLASPVAVKLIATEAAMTTHRLERFVREARTAAASRSPHVVQVLDYGVDETTPYIVMELLEGESLAERLQRVGRLSLRQTERIIVHVSRAIARAHERGIVHRDLKPANVFITHNEDDEVVKIFDFGVAKATESLSIPGKHTRTGSWLGTPYYMSPEQLEGDRQCDYRTDIWAMGVIAFECLLGRLPFTGDTIGILVLAICSRPTPVPSEHGSVPAGFDAWFARACARSRDQRFRSARDAAHEFRRLLDPGLVPIEGAGDPKAAVERAPAPIAQDAARPARAATTWVSAPSPLPRSSPSEPLSSSAQAPASAPSPPTQALALPSTTAAPSSATLDRAPPRQRTRPLVILAPLIGSLTLSYALYDRRRRPPPTVPAPVTVQQAVQPVRQTSSLTVLGDGEGLRLTLDGYEVGPLPRELHGLEPGEHSVAISGGPRHRQFQTRVDLVAGEITTVGPVKLEVARGLATVLLGKGAEGAKVSLKFGDSDMPLPPLPVQFEVDTDKPYTLLAQKKGYESFEQPITFEDGQAEKTFSVDLVKKSRKAAAVEAKRRGPRPSRTRTAKVRKDLGASAVPGKDQADPSSAKR
jgi:serine/threonine protein kinase